MANSFNWVYLKGKIVALYHRFPVVLMQRGRLGLLHLCLELCGEHVLHSVNGSADFNAQLKRFILWREIQSGGGILLWWTLAKKSDMKFKYFKMIRQPIKTAN